MAEKQTDFSKQLRELEQIVEWFESDDVDLDKALAKFERGMELAADLKKHLQSVDNKVEKIKQKFDSSSLTDSKDSE